MALDEWSIVRQLAPEHLPTRLALIRLYLAERRYEEAEDELRAAEEVAPSDERLHGFWRELASAREAGPQVTPAAFFDQLAADHPGTRGVLLVSGGGEVLAGQISRLAGESDEALGANLAGARREAERVAGYLTLGRLKGMVVESEAGRLMLVPLESHTIIVSSEAQVPAGRAARAVQRASQLAGSYLRDFEGRP